MNIYSVRSSYRPDGKTYNVHRTDNVLAEDLMDAAQHVQVMRPHAHIWTVAHKGHLDSNLISDKALDEILERGAHE